MSVSKYVTSLQHIGIPTESISNTAAFYESLGFSLQYHTVNRLTGARTAFFKMGSITIETWEEKLTAGKSGAVDHIALNVTDIDRVFGEIKNSGYHLVDHEIKYLSFWEHGVRYFTIEGPNAEKIEFSQILQK